MVFYIKPRLNIKHYQHRHCVVNSGLHLGFNENFSSDVDITFSFNLLKVCIQFHSRKNLVITSRKSSQPGKYMLYFIPLKYPRNLKDNYLLPSECSVDIQSGIFHILSVVAVVQYQVLERQVVETDQGTYSPLQLKLLPTSLLWSSPSETVILGPREEGWEHTPFLTEVASNILTLANLSETAILGPTQAGGGD